MMINTENQTESTDKLLEIMRELTEVARYTIDIQISIILKSTRLILEVKKAITKVPKMKKIT